MITPQPFKNSKDYAKSNSEKQYDKDMEDALEEKAVSKAQQMAAGIALSAKKGDTPKSKLKGASKDMEKTMSKKDLEDLANTSHSGLPLKVEGKTEQLRRVAKRIRLMRANKVNENIKESSKLSINKLSDQLSNNIKKMKLEATKYVNAKKKNDVKTMKEQIKVLKKLTTEKKNLETQLTQSIEGLNKEVELINTNESLESKIKKRIIEVLNNHINESPNLGKGKGLEKWWEFKKSDLMSYIYWTKKQTPPSDKHKYDTQWKNIITQLNKQYPAPGSTFNKKLKE